METVILYNWADAMEGIVRTEEWGWCYSATCNHVSHDPAFSYFITLIEGEVLWRGEKGEWLVKTETGRVFLTKYWEGDTDEDRRYRPEMWTVEFSDITEASEYIDVLSYGYGSPRHEALVAYREACVRAFPSSTP